MNVTEKLKATLDEGLITKDDHEFTLQWYSMLTNSDKTEFSHYVRMWTLAKHEAFYNRAVQNKSFRATYHRAAVTLAKWQGHKVIKRFANDESKYPVKEL